MALKEKTEEQTPMEGHALRFQLKLDRQNSPVVKLVTWIYCCSLLFFWSRNKQTPKAVEPHTELTLFYEQQINQQLVRLETTYSNRFEVPLRDVRAQMSVLDEEYKKLQASFNEQHQHPLLLRAMIDNPQQRLEILIALEKQLNTKKHNL